MGPPGSGKTTLLKHMALILATSTPKDEQSKAKIRKIPVIIYLRDYINQIVSNPTVMLPEIIDTNTKKLDLELVPNWFSNKLKKGECLILLDGLDEVAEPSARRKIVDWMEHQLHVYHKNAFIITSRPHGYRENPINGVAVLEVMPFNRSQIDSFVQRWYLENEIKSHAADDPGVRMTAKSGADDLLRRLSQIGAHACAVRRFPLGARDEMLAVVLMQRLRAGRDRRHQERRQDQNGNESD